MSTARIGVGSSLLSARPAQADRLSLRELKSTAIARPASSFERVALLKSDRNDGTQRRADVTPLSVPSVPSLMAQERPVPAASRRLLESATADVSANLGLDDGRLLRNTDVEIRVTDGAELGASWSINDSNTRATIDITERTLAASVPSAANRNPEAATVGRAFTESVLVNEMFGVAAAIRVPQGNPARQNRDSQLMEEQSNQASINYLNKHYSDLDALDSLIDVFESVSDDVRAGQGVYANRQAAFPGDAERAQEVMEAMHL
jgi:hypothetical protein